MYSNMDEEKLRKNIIKALTDRGITQKELARRLGKSYEYVNAALRGRVKLAEGLTKDIAEELNTSLERLAALDTDQAFHEYSAGTTDTPVYSVNYLKTKKAGKKVQTTKSELTSPILFKGDWLYERGDPDNMVMVRTNIDVVGGKIPEGSLTLIDLSQTEIIDNNIYLVAIHGELNLKKLSERDGKVMVENDKELQEAEDKELQVVGKCIWFSKDLS